MADSQVSFQSAKLTVEILTGSQKGVVRVFTQDEITIGRSSENDLALVDDVKVSRHHARILMTPEGFEIENMTDKNILFVDGIPTQREKIRNTHRVMLGQTELSVTFDAFANSSLSLQPLIPTQSTGQSVTNFSAQKSLLGDKTTKSEQPLIAPNFQPQQMTVPPPQRMIPAQPHAGPRPVNGYTQNPYAVHTSPNDNSGMLKMVVLGIVGLVTVYFVFFDQAKRKPASTDVYRTSNVIQEDRDKLKKSLDELDKQDSKLESLQFRRAQENLDKALRDFRNGQYSLARDKFLLVLSLDPQNQTAKRYEQLSRFRLDEQIKYFSLQGRKYYERQNYRLCAASFEKVIILIQKKDDRQFQEAAEFLKLCQQSMNTRYE